MFSWILFFLINPFLHIKVMYFSSFGSISEVLGAFYISIANFLKICTICICRNLVEALPDFLQLFSKKMFVNGYVYQKSIFPVFKVLHMAGSSSFLNKEYFWLHKFYFIYLINVIVVILKTHCPASPRKRRPKRTQIAPPHRLSRPCLFDLLRCIRPKAGNAP